MGWHWVLFSNGMVVRMLCGNGKAVPVLCGNGIGLLCVEMLKNDGSECVMGVTMRDDVGDGWW